MDLPPHLQHAADELAQAAEAEARSYLGQRYSPDLDHYLLAPALELYALGRALEKIDPSARALEILCEAATVRLAHKRMIRIREPSEPQLPTLAALVEARAFRAAAKVPLTERAAAGAAALARSLSRNPTMVGAFLPPELGLAFRFERVELFDRIEAALLERWEDIVARRMTTRRVDWEAAWKAEHRLPTRQPYASLLRVWNRRAKRLKSFTDALTKTVKGTLSVPDSTSAAHPIGPILFSGSPHPPSSPVHSDRPKRRRKDHAQDPPEDRSRGS